MFLEASQPVCSSVGRGCKRGQVVRLLFPRTGPNPSDQPGDLRIFRLGGLPWRCSRGWPGCFRCTASSRAASASYSSAPHSRTQWWVHPGPSRLSKASCADLDHRWEDCNTHLSLIPRTSAGTFHLLREIETTRAAGEQGILHGIQHGLRGDVRSAGESPRFPALEATQGQMDGFFSQFPYKCHQNRVAYVGD